jgi:chitodextrinase
VGSQVGTVTLNGATWQVWQGNIGWNVISYVRSSATTSIDFLVNTFYADAVNRGYAQRSWYMTSIQAGFEPWVGQTGLAVNTFSVTTSGGGGDTQPPTTPGNLQAGSITSSSAALSWSASSDNIGVSGYQVSRNGSPITVVGGTSYAATGLSPSTNYQFSVSAVDAAGNASAPATVSFTTAPGGGGGGTCSATFGIQSEWQQGYVENVTVRNTSTSAISGWTVTFTLPAGHSITNSWGAQLTISGQNVTARNMPYNGNLGPNATTTWGFQASRTSGGLPTTASCG